MTRLVDTLIPALEELRKAVGLSRGSARAIQPDCLVVKRKPIDQGYQLSYTKNEPSLFRLIGPFASLLRQPTLKSNVGQPVVIYCAPQ